MDNRLTTTVGMKNSKFDFDIKQVGMTEAGIPFKVNNATQGSSDWEQTFRAGATYDLSDSHSVYLSYSESFQPQPTANGDGTVIPPQMGEQIELGVKGDSAKGLFYYQIALFDLARENNFRPSGDTPGLFVKQPAEDIRGAEAMLSLRPNDHLELIGSYTYLDATKQADGTRLNRIPRHQVSAFARYKFGEALEGLSIGIGVRAHDETLESVTMKAFENGVWDTPEAPGFNVWNAVVEYRASESLNFQLNIENLFDQTYYPFWNNNNRIDVGEPFTAKLTARYRF